MSALETRGTDRNSLYILGSLEIDGEPERDSVKVRNLSATGAMIEAPYIVECGTAVRIELRGVGLVDGMVAWAEGRRIGIAFNRPINPSEVKLANGTAYDLGKAGRPDLRVNRPASALGRPAEGYDIRSL